METIVVGNGRAIGEVVAEVQGLYGPFSFSERLLQKIWLKGDFDRAAAATVDGKKIRILHPGKWNLLGGPDFKDARLQIGDAAICGDVELHLHAGDWVTHGHALDPAYGRVALHAVLFPPDDGNVTRGGDGLEIPVLVLLPLLPRGLEEFAAEEAVETLANRPVAWAVEGLARLGAAELARLIHGCALARWRQKLDFAALRVARLGWHGACHHAALEILGYRFNRAPMLRVAGRFPLADWSGGACDPGAVFEQERETWSLQGVRPANQPRTRLRQYASWAASRPDWPARLEAMVAHWPAGGRMESPATGDYRRLHRMAALRDRFAEHVCGSAVSGSRIDNLVCDGMLPLLGVRTGLDFAACWYHWFPGDVPRSVLEALHALGLADVHANPVAQGAAQGFLGWLIERERVGWKRVEKASRSPGIGDSRVFPRVPRA